MAFPVEGWRASAAVVVRQDDTGSAAAAFVIGHHLSIKQGRAIRQAMANEYGDKVQVRGDTFHAFPSPKVLKKITRARGVSPTKIPRLHGIADAALEGWLNRSALRLMPEKEALMKIRSLKGIGEFFSQGVLYRGAGLADAVPDDEVTRLQTTELCSSSRIPGVRFECGRQSFFMFGFGERMEARIART